MDSKEERIARNQKFYNMEFEIHGRSVAETSLCIKHTIDSMNARILLEDAFPGFVRRNFPKVDDFFDKLDRKSILWWLSDLE